MQRARAARPARVVTAGRSSEGVPSVAVARIGGSGVDVGRPGPDRSADPGMSLPEGPEVPRAADGRDPQVSARTDGRPGPRT